MDEKDYWAGYSKRLRQYGKGFCEYWYNPDPEFIKKACADCSVNPRNENYDPTRQGQGLNGTCFYWLMHSTSLELAKGKLLIKEQPTQQEREEEQRRWTANQELNQQIKYREAVEQQRRNDSIDLKLDFLSRPNPFTK